MWARFGLCVWGDQMPWPCHDKWTYIMLNWQSKSTLDLSNTTNSKDGVWWVPKVQIYFCSIHPALPTCSTPWQDIILQHLYVCDPACEDQISPFSRWTCYKAVNSNRQPGSRVSRCLICSLFSTNEVFVENPHLMANWSCLYHSRSSEVAFWGFPVITSDQHKCISGFLHQRLTAYIKSHLFSA